MHRIRGHFRFTPTPRERARARARVCLTAPCRVRSPLGRVAQACPNFCCGAERHQQVALPMLGGAQPALVPWAFGAPIVSLGPWLAGAQRGVWSPVSMLPATHSTHIFSCLPSLVGAQGWAMSRDTRKGASRIGRCEDRSRRATRGRAPLPRGDLWVGWGTPRGGHVRSSFASAVAHAHHSVVPVRIQLFAACEVWRPSSTCFFFRYTTNIVAPLMCAGNR